MRNLFLLPTDKVSRLFQISNKPLILDSKFESGTTNKHIYITDDSEIKKGDWYIADDKVYQAIADHNNPLTKDSCKKIILTTDLDLIKEGVQAIDDTFLEWFVKNPICEFVETFYSDKDLEGYWRGIEEYQIIIPKEEAKQETLQDLLNKKANQSSTVDLDAYANGLDAGAEWQAERMYSYDELRRIAYNAYCLGQLENPTESKYNLWIQKFKK